MVDKKQWSVDRLAASNLLAALELDATDEMIDKAARHFAEHRRNMVGWAVEESRSGIVRAMESASQPFFSRQSDDWAEGFRHAEELVLSLDPDELLNPNPGKPLSRGQILRSMLRQARTSQG